MTKYLIQDRKENLCPLFSNWDNYCELIDELLLFVCDH